jgi:hypothetical protein
MKSALLGASAELLKEIAKKGSITLKCRGRSMGYSVRDGDFMEVHYIPHEDIGLGDIVLFMKQDTLLSHRVIKVVRKKSGVQFVVKGDALLDIEGNIQESEIIGRVEKVRRKGREIVFSERNRIFRVLIAWYSSLLSNVLGRFKFYRAIWDNPHIGSWKRKILRFSERCYRLPIRILSFFEEKV